MSEPARREMGLAIAGAVVAGGLALSAAGRPWATVVAVRPRPLPSVTDRLTGGEIAPLVSAMGLLLLAGAVALFAVRGRGRVVVGAVLVAAGAVLVWSGLRPMVSGVHPALDDLSTPAGSSVTALHTTLSVGWPLLALVAGVLAVVAGGLVVLRGRTWPAMGRRYERPGAGTTAPARELTDEERATAAWRALDRGEDPTAG